MWNENLSWGAGPGCGARMRVLGCSRGPMRGPVSPYGVTGHAPFSDRDSRNELHGSWHAAPADRIGGLACAPVCRCGCPSFGVRSARASTRARAGVSRASARVSHLACVPRARRPPRPRSACASWGRSWGPVSSVLVRSDVSALSRFGFRDVYAIRLKFKPQTKGPTKLMPD